MTSLTIAETQGERQKALLKMLRRFLDSDDCGQTLMLFAGGLAVLLALVGLAVDVGQLVHTRTDLQKMSDAAVLAAIQDIAGGAGVLYGPPRDTPSRRGRHLQIWSDSCSS